MIDLLRRFQHTESKFEALADICWYIIYIYIVSMIGWRSRLTPGCAPRIASPTWSRQSSPSMTSLVSGATPDLRRNARSPSPQPILLPASAVSSSRYSRSPSPARPLVWTQPPLTPRKGSPAGSISSRPPPGAFVWGAKIQAEAGEAQRSEDQKGKETYGNMLASIRTFQIQSDSIRVFFVFFCIRLSLRASPVFDLLHCNMVQAFCKWQGPVVAALRQPPRLQSPPPREETPSKQRPMFPAQRPPTPQIPQVAHGPRQRPEGPLVPQPQRRTNQVVTPLRRMPQDLPMQCLQAPQSPHLQSLRTVLTTPVQTPRQIQPVQPLQPVSFTPVQSHRQMPVAQPVPMCFPFVSLEYHCQHFSFILQCHFIHFSIFSFFGISTGFLWVSSVIF